MMTLKKGDLFKQSLSMSFRKLSGCNAFKPKVAYNLMRLSKILEQESKRFREEQIELTKKYVDWENELTKSFKMNEEKSDFLWRDGVDVPAARRELEEFLAQEFTVNRFKFEVEDLEPAKLTPVDYDALDFMINQPEE
jgi:hypothetical protein